MGAKSRLQKQLIGICLISLFTCVLGFWLYNVLACAFLQPLAITGMTVFFHLAARLLIGTIFEKIYHNQMHFCRPWFRPKPWEARLYKALRVKQWKKYMPTFSPETFAFDKQRLHSILGATCQAEMVHLCSVAVSFVPLLFCQMVRRLCRICHYLGAGRRFRQRVCHPSAVQPRAYVEFAEQTASKGECAMKKVKITVLKTTLDKELAAEYGVQGLGPLPYAKGRTGVLCRLCQAPGPVRRSLESLTSMYLRLHTARTRACFITATG